MSHSCPNLVSNSFLYNPYIPFLIYRIYLFIIIIIIADIHTNIDHKMQCEKWRKKKKKKKAF